jgi:hypothetical protein
MALSAEDQAWRDAYYIADVGASNPKGVARTMEAHINTVGADHPAVRAIAGHLEFLQGHGIGPEFDDLAAVKANARRLGIIDDAGRYVGDARG